MNFKPGSKGWKKLMGFVYGWGASIVLMGALFKIQHWPLAGTLLIVGLTTEAIIFAFSAFEPAKEDVDWSLVYPELAESDQTLGEPLVTRDQRSVTEQLDDMLESAKIEPELIASLGEGMRSLSDNAKAMSDITGAVSATTEYADSLKGAAHKVGELSETYAHASNSLVSLTTSMDASQSAGENLSRMSKNLSDLNEMYELQLRTSREKLEAANEVFGGVAEMIANLNESVDDTKRYKENIAELSENLGKLNTVYGNMLAAMSVRS